MSFALHKMQLATIFALLNYQEPKRRCQVTECTSTDTDTTQFLGAAAQGSGVQGPNVFPPYLEAQLLACRGIASFQAAKIHCVRDLEAR